MLGVSANVIALPSDAGAEPQPSKTKRTIGLIFELPDFKKDSMV
jgi:hypothetical protein